MNTTITLSEILACLPSLASQHARTTPIYTILEKAVQQALDASTLKSPEPTPLALGPFGDILLPYFKMGAVDTLDLFGLDELMIFSFYWANRGRYRTASDIGANVGLHSLLMGKCGWVVKSYEPDPTHATVLKRNLALNHSTSVEVVEAAVSAQPGSLEFVRVLGNTTSSHLSGAKQNAYGELERFPVIVEGIAKLMPESDFVKMDAEGQEKIIILGTTSTHWNHTDMMVEIGSEENATAIFDHLKTLGVNAFAQKIGWAKVTCLEDLPKHYKHGSVFLSKKPAMLWA